MSDKTKVELYHGLEFGFTATFGAIAALGIIMLIGSIIDRVESMFSAHKAHYVVSVTTGSNGEHDDYVTEDYSRKLSGQIVFKDCDTANQINIPANHKIEIANLDQSAAKSCKVK
jgi:hypothetical protein